MDYCNKHQSSLKDVRKKGKCLKSCFIAYAKKSHYCDDYRFLVPDGNKNKALRTNDQEGIEKVLEEIYETRV